MDKLKLSYFVDLFLALAMFLVIITGLLKFPGLLRYLSISTRLFPWYYINKIHDWGGIALIIGVILHLVLHWDWVVMMTKKTFKK